MPTGVPRRIRSTRGSRRSTPDRFPPLPAPLTPQVPLREKYALVERVMEIQEWQQSKRSKTYSKRVPVSFVRRGGRIWWFFWYDVSMVAFTYSLFRDDMGGAHHGWFVWTSAWYWSATYACLMIPYACLMIPFVQSILSQGARPTGYDASGFIGAVLSPAQIQELNRMSEVERKKLKLVRDAQKLATKKVALVRQGMEPKVAEELAREQLKRGDGWGFLSCAWPKELRRSDLGEEQDTAARKAALSHFEAEAHAIAQKAAVTQIGAWVRGRMARRTGKEQTDDGEGGTTSCHSSTAESKRAVEVLRMV